MIRPVNSMIMGPLLHLFCCEVSPLLKSNTVWNTMIEDKAFYKSKDGRCGRSTVCKEGKFIARVSIYFSKNKVLHLP